MDNPLNSISALNTSRLTGYYAYWGKAGQQERANSSCHLLAYHCLDVAAVGEVLLRNQRHITAGLSQFLGVDVDIISRWTCFMLALHDIGKFADGFQNQRPDLMYALQGRRVRTGYEERHDTLGYRVLREKIYPGFVDTFQPAGMDGSDLLDLLLPWINAVEGHHGRPPKLRINKLPLSRQIPDLIVEDVKTFINDLISFFFPEGLSFDCSNYSLLARSFKRVSWLMAGLAVAADWIGSNVAWFTYYDQSIPITDYWMDRALPLAERAVAESGLVAAEPAGWSGMQNLFPDIKSATPLQQMVEEVNLSDYPQLFIIEEVTGGGKTEAAVALAHRLINQRASDGIYMALPTMATANAMHSRVRKVYRRLFAEGTLPSLVLAHSMSRMMLDLEEKNRSESSPSQNESSASRECSEWLSDSRKKALLAHVGVGTIDQALLAVLAARHQSMRLFGLCRKVLIVDEVHACDAYVHRILCTLLKFHAALGGSAILLSATLPARMRGELLNAFADGLGNDTQVTVGDAYPLFTHLTVEGKAVEYSFAARKEASRTVTIRALHKVDDVANILLSIVESGGCACWVRNTVDDALDAYHEWVNRLGEDRVTLYHARYALVDRLAIEKNVLHCFGPKSAANDRHGRLLIATQVVEQSLDLDFDFMVSDLAPIDLIIQRSGRLKRHTRDEEGNSIDGPDRRSPPELGVFMPMPSQDANEGWFRSLLPKASYVYGHHGQLWLTARWLLEHKAFSMPEDARDMIEAVYSQAGQVEIPEGLHKVSQKAEGQSKGNAALGSLNALKLDQGYEASATDWQDDVYAPTRIGEPTIVVRLARWENECLIPWAEADPRHSWELSQLSIRRARIADDPSDYSEGDLAAARESMPDRGKFCVIIPLEQNPDNRWFGHALNQRGGMVRVSYDPRFGLQYLRGDTS